MLLKGELGGVIRPSECLWTLEVRVDMGGGMRVCLCTCTSSCALLLPTPSLINAHIYHHTQGGSTLVLSLEKAKPTWWRSVLKVRCTANDTHTHTLWRAKIAI